MALRFVALCLILTSAAVSVFVLVASAMFAPAGTIGLVDHPVAKVMLALPLIGVVALAVCAWRDAAPRTMAAIGALPLLAQGLTLLTFVRMGTFA